MRKEASSKSSLFLLEMMISILFFAAAAAVCIQVFVKAHQLSEKAENLNMAAEICTSAAELLASENNEEQISLYYDENWMPCEKQEAVFFLKITSEIASDQEEEKEYGLKKEKISVCDRGGENIYSLDTAHYSPRKIKREEKADE